MDQGGWAARWGWLLLAAFVSFSCTFSEPRVRPEPVLSYQQNKIWPVGGIGSPQPTNGTEARPPLPYSMVEWQQYPPDQAQGRLIGYRCVEGPSLWTEPARRFGEFFSGMASSHDDCVYVTAMPDTIRMCQYGEQVPAFGPAQRSDDHKYTDYARLISWQTHDLIWHSDYNCYNFLARASSFKTNAGVSQGVISAILSATTTIMTPISSVPALVPTAINGGNSAIGGSIAAINSGYFASQSFEVMEVAIEAKRRILRSEINARICRTFEQARQDEKKEVSQPAPDPAARAAANAAALHAHAISNSQLASAAADAAHAATAATAAAGCVAQARAAAKAAAGADYSADAARKYATLAAGDAAQAQAAAASAMRDRNDPLRADADLKQAITAYSLTGVHAGAAAGATRAAAAAAARVAAYAARGAPSAASAAASAAAAAAAAVAEPPSAPPSYASGDNKKFDAACCGKDPCAKTCPEKPADPCVLPATEDFDGYQPAPYWDMQQAMSDISEYDRICSFEAGLAEMNQEAAAKKKEAKDAEQNNPPTTAAALGGEAAAGNPQSYKNGKKPDRKNR